MLNRANLTLISCAVGVAFVGCGPTAATRTTPTAAPGMGSGNEGLPPNPSDPRPVSRPRPEPSRWPFKAKLERAEREAHPAGRAVLKMARKMINTDVVVIGSCWGYVNAVFNRAGFKHWTTRKTIYRRRKKGPYANPNLVKPGDWLYVINHPEFLGSHSVIFVYWVDKKRREAKVVTYVGGRRDEGAWYRDYDVSRIYHIRRARYRKRPVKASRSK